MRVRGHLCRTHQASNTAFRGFGGPQVRGPETQLLAITYVACKAWSARCGAG